MQQQQQAPPLQLGGSARTGSNPASASHVQVAFPNGGVALYGHYKGSVGPNGQRYRLRLFYSGGAAASQQGGGGRISRRFKRHLPHAASAPRPEPPQA